MRCLIQIIILWAHFATVAAAKLSFTSSTFCIFCLLVLKALVKLPCMIVTSLRRLMEDLVLSCHRAVNTLHHSIKLIIWHTSLHVPEGNTMFSFRGKIKLRKACTQTNKKSLGNIKKKSMVKGPVVNVRLYKCIYSFLLL